MKWAICEKFLYLGYADYFTVYTDNNPSLYFLTSSKVNAHGQRWISELSEYNFSIKYRPGRINKDADCLSRLPLDINKYKTLCEKNVDTDTFNAIMANVSAEVSSWKVYAEAMQAPNLDLTAMNTKSQEPLPQLKQDQLDDEWIRPVIDVLKGNCGMAEEMPPGSKVLLRERKRLYFDDNNILRRKCKDANQVVLPLKHRDLIYKSLHDDLGHLGAERVHQLARQRVYWPWMQADIEQYTQRRCRCLIQRRPRVKPVAPLQSIHSATPMELVTIDFLHLEKSSGGHEYILLIVDHFTRFAQGYATKNNSGKTSLQRFHLAFWYSGTNSTLSGSRV
jgi:hypothetical protein